MCFEGASRSSGVAEGPPSHQANHCRAGPRCVHLSHCSTAWYSLFKLTLLCAEIEALVQVNTVASTQQSLKKRRVAQTNRARARAKLELMPISRVFSLDQDQWRNLEFIESVRLLVDLIPSPLAQSQALLPIHVAEIEMALARAVDQLSDIITAIVSDFDFKADRALFAANLESSAPKKRCREYGKLHLAEKIKIVDLWTRKILGTIYLS